MTEKEQRLLDIINNEEISDKIENAESVEEVLQIMAENGLETSAEELGILGIDATGDELDEASLEEVAGGGKVGAKIKSWWNKLKQKAKKYGQDKKDYYIGVWEGLTEGL